MADKPNRKTTGRKQTTLYARDGRPYSTGDLSEVSTLRAAGYSATPPAEATEAAPEEPAPQETDTKQHPQVKNKAVSAAKK